MKLRDEMFSVERWEADNVRVRLHADHVIYKAHFPGNPITPGVCLIQMIGELLEQRQAASVQLSKVVNLKFISPISPLDSPVLDVLFSPIVEDGQEVKSKGTIMSGGQVMTKFSLIFNKLVGADPCVCPKIEA